MLQPDQAHGATFGAYDMTYNDDMFTGWLGIGIQIDSLGHLGIDGVYYNGNKAEDLAKATGLTKLGIEKIPPIVTRGVRIDMAKHEGVDRMNEGEIISADDIQAAMEAQGVEVREGDVVVYHTGWLSMLDEDPARYGAGEPGIDAGAAEYLATLSPVAVGMDDGGIEAVPFASDRVWEGHQILLAKNGICIRETLDTRELVADGVQESCPCSASPLTRVRCRPSSIPSRSAEEAPGGASACLRLPRFAATASGTDLTEA